MIDTLIKANLPLLKTVFIAGAVAGVAVGGTVGIGVGYVMGTLLAAKSGEGLPPRVREINFPKQDLFHRLYFRQSPSALLSSTLSELSLAQSP
jgi:hypothetical protein